ncbi:MAG: SPASM domain-containing protein [Candidatus Xenobiia bacterium LiM19]
MAQEEPMSFLFCEVDFDLSRENRLKENFATFIGHVKPYVKELTFRWSDPSTRESRPLFDAVEAIGIPFAIRTEGHWSDHEAFLRRASRSPLLTALIISDFDERYIRDSSRLDMSFFHRLTLFCTIRQACSYGIPVRTVTPLNGKTERDLEELLTAACECGAEAVMLERQYKAFGIDASAVREKYRRILARMHTFKKEGWPVSFEGCMPLCAHRGFYRTCGAGVTSCVIRSDGGVYLCEHSERAVGNILEAPLHSVYCCEEVVSWQNRQDCEASSCEVKDECRGGCPFLGESVGARRDPLADLSSFSQKGEFTLPIAMDEELEVIPRFELRRGQSGIFTVSEREFLRAAPGEESLFQFLLEKPALRDVARLYGETSLRTVFSLYRRGFVSFARSRVRLAAAESSQGIKREKRRILDFNQNLLLKLSSEAEFFRRNNSVLVLHPPSAAFRVLPLSLCYLVKGLAEPCYFDAFCREHAWLGRDAAEHLVRNLYLAGFVEVNGINFWNSGSLMASPEEEYIECSLQCRDGQMNYMERESLVRILTILAVHYHGRKKILELLFEKSDEGMGEWLQAFFMEKRQCAFLEEEESDIRIVLKDLPFSAEVLSLLKEHSVKMELQVQDDSEYDPEMIHMICSHGVTVILRIVAETPLGAVTQLQRYGDSGVSAIRLEPRINYSDYQSIEEWGRAYVRLFDELYGPGRNNGKVSLKVIDFEELIGSLHTKGRKGGSCFRHPCGAGTLRIAFSRRGDLFPCARMIASEEFNCGSINPETDPKIMATGRIETVLGDIESRTRRCGRCSWRNVCPGGCPVVYRDQNLTAQDADPACGFKRHILEEFTGRIMAGRIGIKAPL